MTIQEFVEAAIEGNWIPSPLRGQMNYGWEFKDKSMGFFRPTFEIWDDIGTVRDMHIEEILLDPEAWKAVGRSKGFIDETDTEGRPVWWYVRMHEMISFIAKNDYSLEEYIATL